MDAEVTQETLNDLKVAWKFKRDFERRKRWVAWKVWMMRPWWRILDWIEPR